MSVLSVLQKRLVPTKWLAGIFLGCFFIVIILKLPVSLLSNSLNNAGIEYNDYEGTVWDGEFSDAIVANIFWNSASVMVRKAPLLWGTIEADFTLKNKNSNISGNFIGFRDGLLSFKSVDVFTSVMFEVNDKTYPSNIHIYSEDAVFDKEGGCHMGTFNIKTDFIDNLFSKIDLKLNPLVGRGECYQGNIKYILQSVQGDMTISVNGEAVRNTQIGDITLKLSQSIKHNNLITNELLANGFKKSNDEWRIPMKGHL